MKAGQNQFADEMVAELRRQDKAAQAHPVTREDRVAEARIETQFRRAEAQAAQEWAEAEAQVNAEDARAGALASLRQALTLLDAAVGLTQLGCTAELSQLGCTAELTQGAAQAYTEHLEMAAETLGAMPETPADFVHADFTPAFVYVPTRDDRYE